MTKNQVVKDVTIFINFFVYKTYPTFMGKSPTGPLCITAVAYLLALSLCA
jgi:hypothetical protein